MRGYIANTDYDWFTYLRSVEPPIDEVNFWRPGSDAVFRALDPGEPFFFRLKAPRGAIGGHGFFVHFSKLPVSVAWETFGQANGAATYGEMRDRLLGIRKRFNMDADPKRDFHIGCILINQPVFFDDGDFVRSPTDFTGPIVGGKTYDLDSGEGERIWLECRARAAPRSVLDVIGDRPLPGGYGPPSLVRQRLGQRSFRVVVLDSYERRCARDQRADDSSARGGAHPRLSRRPGALDQQWHTLPRRHPQAFRHGVRHRHAGPPLRGEQTKTHGAGG